MSNGRRQQNAKPNFNRSLRTALQLPKIQVDTGTHKNKNMIYQHASLSPLDDRRVNTSCDFKLTKTTFYNYPQDFSSTAAAAVEEQKQKYSKQPLRSAHVSRNLFSGSKKKTRKASQNNIKDTSNQCLSTPSSLPKIRSTSSKRQESESLQNLPAIILRSPSMQLNGSATPGLNLSPSQLLLNQNKSVQFKDQNDYLNLEKEGEIQLKSSQTPVFKKAPSLKHSTSGQQLQPIFESTNGKRKKMVTEESISGNVSSSINRNSVSRENNNNNSLTTAASLNHTLIFSGVPSSTISRKSNNNNNKQNEEEIEKLKGENQNLMKEFELFRLSYQAAIEKKNREMEQLQLENSRLKFQLQSIQREQQKQSDLAGRLNQKKNGQSSANNQQRKSLLQKELVALQDAQFCELLMQLDIGYENIKKYAKQNEQEDALVEVEGQFNRFKLFVKEIQKQQQSQTSSRETNIEVNARLRFFPASLISFEHSQRLGKGGFGTVFRVKVGEQDMGQKVFEYDLEKEMSCLGERLEMLINEVKIQTLASMAADNTYFAQIFGISFEIRHHPLSGRTSFVFALFMQLVGNRGQKEQKFITTDLKQHTALHIKDKDYQRQYIGLAVQIAEAVETLYNNHIVHSDLKPQNILLDSNNNIKIIDFGTSKINYHQETHDTLILGYTPRYCPIEHFDMTSLTPTTDVWSFGCLLFEMATGQEPWRGFKKSFDVRKALEDKQNLWANYVSQVDSHPEQFDPDVIKLIESCTAYENRPHPSFISEKMHEIYSRILQI